jgi:TolA-binding protein
MVCLTFMAGCTGDKGKELLDTAQFEEKQHNEEHALKLYEEIVKKYPGTEFAQKASERLRVIKGK